MEIAINSPQLSGRSTFLNNEREFEVLEYAEDGTMKKTKIAYSTADENNCINPVTAIRKRISLKNFKKVGYRGKLSQLLIDELFDFANTIEAEDNLDAVPLTMKDYNSQFREINNFFCFNKTEWAKIFSVSRVTIYDWIKGETRPSGGNAKKINSIFKLLSTISAKETPISRTYLYLSISKYDKSLLEIFLSSQDIMMDYKDLATTIEAMINQSEKNKFRLIKLSKIRQPKDETLDYNLENLNFSK